MHEFSKYSPFEDKRPAESGAYNTITFTRDNVPVIEVSYYDAYKRQWYRRRIEEYGYSEEFKIDDNYISYFKQIEGVGFVVIPETYDIDIPGVKLEDDDE